MSRNLMSIASTCLGGTLLLALISCGGGGGSGSATNGGTGGSGGTGGELAYESSRSDVIDSIVDQYIQYAPRSNPANRSNFITWVKSLPAIEDAGWSTEGDNFWARFRDGVPYVIADNRLPGPPEIIPTSTQTRVARIPASKTAVLIQTLGTAFQDYTATQESMLKGAGYTTSKSAGTIEALTQDLKGAGFLWYSTHSAEFQWRAGVKSAAISTNTNYTKNLLTSSALMRDLANKQMVVASSVLQDKVANPTDKNKNGKIDDEEAYTYRKSLDITPKFVTAYFVFGEGSMVLQDSCESAIPQIANAYLGAGTNIFVGWDKVTTSTLQMPRLTDRLLGGNLLSPKDTPPDRPFEFNATWSWLLANGYEKASNGARMVKFFKSGTDNGILTPSVERLTITEGTLPTDVDLMKLKGTFGPDPRNGIGGSVTVGGTALTKFRSWAPDEIVVEIPTTGPGSAGDCQVSVGDRLSNVVPITLWNQVFKSYSDFGFGGTAKIELTFDLKFRGDVHKSWTAVGQAPTGPVVTMAPRRDSTLTWVASGTSGDDTCPEALSGTGQATMYDLDTTLGGALTVNVATGQLQTFIAVAGVNRNGITLTDTCSGDTTSLPVGGAADPAYIPPVQFEPGTFNIKAGQSGPLVWDQPLPITYGYQWSAGTAQYVPSNLTES